MTLLLHRDVRSVVHVRHDASTTRAGGSVGHNALQTPCQSVQRIAAPTQLLRERAASICTRSPRTAVRSYLMVGAWFPSSGMERLDNSGRRQALCVCCDSHR
jgi:hypothetical protein